MKQSAVPIRVDLIGSSQRTRDTLSMVLDGPAKGICAFSDSHSADAVIIDLDGIGSLDQWEKYRNKNPGHPAIVLTVKAGDFANADEVLVKPIKIPEFCAAMKRVAEKVTQRKNSMAGMGTHAVQKAGSFAGVAPNQVIPITESEPSTQAVPALVQELEPTVVLDLAEPSTPPRDFKEVCGCGEDIDPENTEQISGLLVSLDNRLLGAVLHAQSESERQQMPISVKLKHIPLFVLFPRQKVASWAIKEDMQQRLCLKTFPADCFEMDPAPERLPEMDNPSTGTIEGMLWKMAVWTYCGKLPHDVRLQERVFLRHWPNLTRLLELPNAMRISALLADHHMTLVSVAEALAIPQRHVFAFYGAAHTAGLMGVTRRNSDYLMESPPKPPENSNRKLFGRMMHHLRKLLS